MKSCHYANFITMVVPWVVITTPCAATNDDKKVGIMTILRLHWNFETSIVKTLVENLLYSFISTFPDSKVHGANMGPIWGRQDPGGPHVGPINFAIWELYYLCMNDLKQMISIIYWFSNIYHVDIIW